MGHFPDCSQSLIESSVINRLPFDALPSSLSRQLPICSMTTQIPTFPCSSSLDCQSDVGPTCFHEQLTQQNDTIRSPISSSSRLRPEKVGESWPRSTVEFRTFDRKFLIVWDLSIVCQHLTYNFVIIDKLIKSQVQNNVSFVFHL